MKKILSILALISCSAFAQTNSFNILDRSSSAITSGTINGVTIGATTPSTVSATTITSSGQAILGGTTTNDSAGVGKIGEMITATVASGSAVPVTTATGMNVTSIILTAGDWDVSGQADYILSGVTATLFQSGLSLTSATLPTQAGGGGLGTDALVVVPLITTLITSNYQQAISPVRISLASTTTVYLVAQSTFSLGSTTAYGTIRARRMR